MLDLKSGVKNPCSELQLAAYCLLVNEGVAMNPELTFPAYEVAMYHPIYRFAGTVDMVLSAPAVRAYAIHLQEDGLPKIEDYSKNLRVNAQIFLSFLTAHKWASKNNLQRR